ncbi:MAG: hypothetical protein LBF89_05815, partial [Bacteroidales bacterium]|nr:hypothetical protein [Bacteroidales bacterium]
MDSWRFKDRNKYFQREYRYTACTSGIKEKVTEMAINGSSVKNFFFHCIRLEITGFLSNFAPAI